MAKKSEKKGSEVVGALSRLLASSYTLYLKTHNFHWNVKGPMFTTLHTLFELEYTELALAVDAIAERIRSVGAPAPATYTAFQQLSTVKERAGVPSAKEMIKELVRDQGIVAESARDGVAGGRRGRRRRQRRPRGAAHPGAREERLDAAQSPGLGIGRRDR